MSHLNLNDRLRYIGIQLSGERPDAVSEFIDIEQTLFEACLEVKREPWIFSLLCSWVLVHGNRVIVEKLLKLQRVESSPWLVGLAIFAFNSGYHRWKKLIKKQKSAQFFVDKELALSAIELKGAEPGFMKYNFLIAKGSLRVRSKDVLSVEEISKLNLQYRNRLLFGSAWRADIITGIQLGFETPYEIAKKLGCSYEPAHRIFKEYRIATN